MFYYRGIKYNDGTVPIELIIQSNTKISILREHILSEEVDDETVDYPLVDLANCFQHLNKKIRLQLYIKTNFDIIRNKKTNINSCCGSLVDKFKWKIEARIINFEIPFTNHFTKGQHVEVIGIIDISYQNEDDNDYPVVQINECYQYLREKIRLQGYIKTNFDIVKNRIDNTSTCQGSLANKLKFKLEAKIIHFELPFINRFNKGDHVEVIGVVKKIFNSLVTLTQNIPEQRFFECPTVRRVADKTSKTRITFKRFY
ncbi:Protein of unknown function [Cotesia congregata]|uniref:Uncharacterized protein n=1 Tax=Cotesia congregata TaxID=51543 RepID=A0A8J2MWA4_COTCN|nr:Protein of unknown function [Cotesia congregata]